MIDIISKGVQKAEKGGSDKKKQAVKVVPKMGIRNSSKIITIIMSGRYMYHPLIITLLCATAVLSITVSAIVR